MSARSRIGLWNLSVDRRLQLGDHAAKANLPRRQRGREGCCIVASERQRTKAWAATTSREGVWTAKAHVVCFSILGTVSAKLLADRPSTWSSDFVRPRKVDYVEALLSSWRHGRL